jgi:GTP cyclohydrolase IIa
MLAITNGVSREEHKEIQANINERFPFTVSMSIGVNLSPFNAHVQASKLMQMAGSAQCEQRKSALTVGETIPIEEAYAQVIHIDVDDITHITDHGSALQTSQRLLQLHLDLMKVFAQMDSLLFYLGGDNFMAVTGELSEEVITEKLRNYSLDGLPLKFGLGRSQTARKAAELATTSLERVRLNRARESCVAFTSSS